MTTEPGFPKNIENRSEIQNEYALFRLTGVWSDTLTDAVLQSTSAAAELDDLPLMATLYQMLSSNETCCVVFEENEESIRVIADLFWYFLPRPPYDEEEVAERVTRLLLAALNTLMCR